MQLKSPMLNFKSLLNKRVMSPMQRSKVVRLCLYNLIIQLKNYNGGNSKKGQLETSMGPNNPKQPAPHEPVRMVTWNDAYAYANWLGHDLPTELEWEYAAKVFSKIPILALPMKAIL
jgi:formylglycine-generating enzyme required for sulfatase activity